MTEIEGVKVCNLCTECLFNDSFVQVDGEKDTWKVKGQWLGVDTTQNHDAGLKSRGYITLTPITLDRTDYSAIKCLKGLEK